jgi:TetR/AcrR family transcriptional regulator, copper-responsive repressor
MKNMRTGTKMSGKRPARPPQQAPERPRGRPRAFDPDEVLGRVRAVFIEKGFSAASLDDLAAAAGLNRPSLYAAFGNKEELYIRALRHYGGKGIAAMAAILGRKGRIEARLAEVYRGAVDLYTAPPRPAGCMIIGTATVEAPTYGKIAAAATELLAAVEAQFEQAFERAVAAGELKPDPSPATRARLAGAILDTLAVRARLGAKPRDLKAFAASTIPAICR